MSVMGSKPNLGQARGRATARKDFIQSVRLAMRDQERGTDPAICMRDIRIALGALDRRLEKPRKAK